jgi:AbiV family abortive infection protein
MSDGAIHLSALCLDQAKTFIAAADKLHGDGACAHIVHHLALLALEELGKANMVAAHMVVGDRRDSSWIEKSFDNHRRKLQWALWSPVNRIDPKDFAKAGEFAERAHSLRLASLYVDACATQDDLPPNQLITQERATAILELARARWALEDEHGHPSSEPNEILDWFMATLEDPERSKRLMSRSFIDHYAELGGDAREWVAWAREEMAKLDREASEALKAELERSAISLVSGKPRWRLNATVYTSSHALRAKMLQYWNERIDSIQLIWTGKKDQFQLQLSFDDSTPLAELYGKAVSVAKTVVACLNIGSLGYFWFQRPGYEHKIFKEVKDLDRPGMKLLIENLPSFWDDGRAVALTEQHLQHAIECMMTYMPLPSDEAEPIFAPYFHGLAMIAKSDVFYSLDDIGRHAFAASLGGAFHSYAGWDGDPVKFEACFHDQFVPIMPEKADRDQMFAVLNAKGSPANCALENLRTTKHLTDLFLIQTASKRWKGLLKMKP